MLFGEFAFAALIDLEENDTPTKKTEIPLAFSESEDRFYSDPELRDMLITDKMLNHIDSTDIIILKALQNGEPYEKIADLCYLAEGSVKYRIKKMVVESGAEDKQQLLSLLQKFNIVL